MIIEDTEGESQLGKYSRRHVDTIHSLAAGIPIALRTGFLAPEKETFAKSVGVDFCLRKGETLIHFYNWSLIAANG